MAQGRSGRAPPPPEHEQVRNLALGPFHGDRRAVGPRQVGVPLVRGLGHGLPLHGPGPGGPGVGQAPAHLALPGMVHAPQRSASGLRMGFQRRQSAGSRPGRAAGVRARAGADRPGRSRVPGRRSFTRCCSTSPGGSTARTSTAAMPSRGASWGWTTSACSTAAIPTSSTATRSSRPTERPGWRCSASTCWPSRSSCPGSIRAYESMATKFFEHYIAIAHALNGIGGQVGMWHPEDQFYYDVILRPGGEPQYLRVRSCVGLIPMLAVLAIPAETWDRLERFRRRVGWYLRYRTEHDRQRLPAHPAGSGRPPADDDRRPGQARGHPGPAARPRPVPLRPRDPLALPGARGIPVPVPWKPDRLRAGRIVQPDLRRQLELARTDLVPDQLPDHPRRSASTIATSAATSRSSSPPARAGRSI